MAKHPGQDPPDGLVLTQPWARDPAGQQAKEMIYHQYRDRARPPNAAWDQWAGWQGRTCCGGQGADEAEPIHQTHQRQEVGQS